MNDKEKLAAYTKELGWSEPLELDELIASHRAIRENFQALNRMTNEDVQRRAETIARTLYRENYVSVEELKSMTLKEIVEKYL